MPGTVRRHAERLAGRPKPLIPHLVEPGEIPLLTTPPNCSGEPIKTEVSVDSWEEPNNFKHATYVNADLQGNPLTLTGCNQLSYEPTISVAPKSISSARS